MSNLISLGKQLAEVNASLQKIKKELGGGSFPLAPNVGVSHGLEALDFTLDRVTFEIWKHAKLQSRNARRENSPNNTGQ